MRIYYKLLPRRLCVSQATGNAKETVTNCDRMVIRTVTKDTFHTTIIHSYSWQYGCEIKLLLCYSGSMVYIISIRCSQSSLGIYRLQFVFVLVSYYPQALSYCVYNIRQVKPRELECLYTLPWKHFIDKWQFMRNQASREGMHAHFLKIKLPSNLWYLADCTAFNLN